MEAWKAGRNQRCYPGFMRVTGRIMVLLAEIKISGRVYGCVFKGEKEENAFNFRSTKFEYHGTHRKDI